MDKQHEAWLGQLRFSVLPILQYIHRMIGDFTSHGVSHSENIENRSREILQVCNAQKLKCNTSSYEAYLLFASAWLHDLGNIWGREQHNVNSCKIIDQLGSQHIWGLDNNSIELIKWICVSHSSNDPINMPKTISAKGSVKLQYLSAVFRLMDASDIDNQRAPKIVYELIKDKINAETDKHWTSHQAITDIFYPPDEDTVFITVTDAEKAKFAIERYDKKFNSVRDILFEYEFPWNKYEVRTIDRVSY